jgi:hypothetical protein
MNLIGQTAMQIGTEGPIEDWRRRLMATARQYVGSIQSKPGLVGIVLYGSLAWGDPSELTPFSDVDLALLLDGEPPAHGAEQRLAEGMKLDVSLISMGWLREQLGPQPERREEDNWVHNVLLKSFLLGNEETILFDPAGEIAQARREFNALTSFPAMALPGARRWLREVEERHLVPAREQWQDRRFREVIDHCGHALRTLDSILLTLAHTKNRELAAPRLGVPRFSTAASELRQMLTPDTAAAQAYWQTALDLWGYTYHRVYEPLRSELRSAGVVDPDRLEMAGDYPLFWAGNRIVELGRLTADVDLSLTRSHYELARGNVYEALTQLWPCDVNSTIARCQGLAAALEEIGHDITAIVIPFLEDQEFRRLGAEVNEAAQKTRRQEVSSTGAERAVRLAEELRQILGDLLASRAGGAAPDS